MIIPIILLVEQTQLPLWVTVVSFLLIPIAAFYKEIRSTVELWINSKSETKNFNLEKHENEKLNLKKRIKELEIREKTNENKLLKLSAILTTVIPLLESIIDKSENLQYLKSSIEALKSEINDTNS